MQALLAEIERDHLAPDARRVSDASQRIEKLVWAIHASDALPLLHVVRLHPHGSLARGTAIRGFDDIDCIVELCLDTLRTTSGAERTPSDTLNQLKHGVEHVRAGLYETRVLDTRLQCHSVRVAYAGGLCLDLVPAVRRRGGLEIAERDTRSWISTDPERTSARLEQAEAKNPGTKAAIRLLKGWKRARGSTLKLPSFALETVVVSQSLAGRRSVEALVRGFFEVIADRDARQRMALVGDCGGTPVTVRDPVSRANIAEGLDHEHKSRLVRAARVAEDRLFEIDQLMQDGRVGRASRVMLSLFVPTALRGG